MPHASPPYCRDRLASGGQAPTNQDLPLVLRWADRVVDGLIGAYNRLAHSRSNNGAAASWPATCDLPQINSEPDATSLARTLAIQPHNCLAWFQLAMVHLQQRELAEAVEAFNKARRFGFDTFELHFYLAEALAGLQRHEEAVSELYVALDRRPDSAEPPYRLGLSLCELQRHEEAVAAFKIAISLSPNNVRYHQSLGLALEGLGRQDEALRSFKQAVKLERGLGR